MPEHQPRMSTTFDVQPDAAELANKRELPVPSLRQRVRETLGSKASRVVLAASLLILAAACTKLNRTDEKPHSVPNTSQEAPSSTTHQAPSTNKPASRFAGTINLKDGAGYTYRIDYAFLGIGEPQKSIANDPPGRATLSLPASGAIRVINTTPGRYAPSPGYLGFAGFYRSNRPACNVIEPIYHNMREVPSGNTPSADGASTVNTYEGLDESKFTAIAADLQRPDFYMLYGGSGWIPTPSCEFDIGGAMQVSKYISTLATKPTPGPTCHATG